MNELMISHTVIITAELKSIGCLINTKYLF